MESFVLVLVGRGVLKVSGSGSLMILATINRLNGVADLLLLTSHKLHTPTVPR